MNAMTKNDPTQAGARDVEVSRRAPTYQPNVDIVETADEILLVGDVPGADADSIDLEFERGELTLRARIQPRGPQDSQRYLLREYAMADFQRTFRIGRHIDAGRISAEVRDGVLTVHLPKADSIKPRKIKVHPSK